MLLYLAADTSSVDDKYNASGVSMEYELKTILFCCKIIFMLFFVDGQSFNPAAGTFVDKFGNRSQSIEVTWTYDISSLDGVIILCGFQTDYVIRKKGTTAASVVDKYQGRASVIDNVGQRKIGFKLSNVGFGDAKDVSCTLLTSDLTPFYSGVYKIKIYGLYVYVLLR